MAFSVTEIVGFGKDARAMAKHQSHQTHLGTAWPDGPRRHGGPGQGADPESLLGTEYDAWIKPLIEHPIWEFSEVLASEFRLCDRRRSIGGSFDLLLWDTITECDGFD